MSIHYRLFFLFQIACFSSNAQEPIFKILNSTVVAEDKFLERGDELIAGEVLRTNDPTLLVHWSGEFLEAEEGLLIVDSLNRRIIHEKFLQKVPYEKHDIWQTIDCLIDESKCGLQWRQIYCPTFYKEESYYFPVPGIDETTSVNPKQSVLVHLGLNNTDQENLLYRFENLLGQKILEREESSTSIEFDFSIIPEEYYSEWDEHKLVILSVFKEEYVLKNLWSKDRYAGGKLYKKQIELDTTFIVFRLDDSSYFYPDGEGTEDPTQAIENAFYIWHFFRDEGFNRRQQAEIDFFLNQSIQNGNSTHHEISEFLIRSMK